MYKIDYLVHSLVNNQNHKIIRFGIFKNRAHPYFNNQIYLSSIIFGICQSLVYKHVSFSRNI
uniref:Uncharacterized protein n=1 Tax=Manihot esculenta TaxID=3983 RepID=A0A199UAD4_MANES